MQEVVTFTQTEDTLTATLACEIDHHTARTIRERVDKKLFITKPRVLIFDFSPVSFMDSSGIGLILGRCAVCESIGTHVRISGLSPRLMKLVRLAGIEKIKNLSIV